VILKSISLQMNRVGGIMGAPLECGRSWLRVGPGHTKDYKIDMCCFSAISTQH